MARGPFITGFTVSEVLTNPQRTIGRLLEGKTIMNWNNAETPVFERPQCPRPGSGRKSRPPTGSGIPAITRLPGRIHRCGEPNHHSLPTPIVHENPFSSTSALVAPVRTSISPAKS
jgi:hypothetical protein